VAGDHGDRGGAADTSPEGLRRFFEAVAVLAEPDPDPEHRFDFLGPGADHSSRFDVVLAYTNFMIGGEPSTALRVLTTLCENAPGDDALCFLGVRMVEPLLDLHWKEIGSGFEAEARRTPSLRQARSCAWLNLKGSTGQDLEPRLRSLIEPDHVGRRSQ
jgi:hypothetical protein